MCFYIYVSLSVCHTSQQQQQQKHISVQELFYIQGKIQVGQQQLNNTTPTFHKKTNIIFTFLFSFFFYRSISLRYRERKKRRNLLLVMFETRPLSMVLIVRCTPTCVFLFLSIYPSRFQQSIQQSVPEKRVFQDAKHVKYTVYERYRLCVCVYRRHSRTQQSAACIVKP